MREKDRLDVSVINDLFEKRPFHGLVKIGSQGLQSAGGGLAAGGLIVSGLALLGITATFVFQILSATAGAVVFGGLAVVLGVYHLKKEDKKIDKSKETFDKQMDEFKKSILKSIKNYPVAEQERQNLLAEVQRLKKLAENILDAEEKEKNEKLRHELTLKAESLDVISQLQISLQVVAGNSNLERLSQLFGIVRGKAGKNALAEYAELNLPEEEIKAFHKGLDAVWNINVIDRTRVENNTTQRFQTEFEEAIKHEKDKTHSVIKRIIYGLTGVGGFLSGSGTAIAIAGLAVGGFAALIAVGWPVVVAAIGVGIITTVAALAYYHHVDKKQQKVMNKISLATTQISGMNNFLSQKNNTVSKELKAINVKSVEAKNAVGRDLNLHERAVEKMHSDVIAANKELKSLLVEKKKFHIYTATDLQNAAKIKARIDRNIILLEARKEEVSELTVMAGSEERKTKLVSSIEMSLNQARDDADSINQLHQFFNKKLHETPFNKDLISHELKAEENFSVPRPQEFPQEVVSAKKHLEHEEDSEGEGEGEGVKANKFHK